MMWIPKFLSRYGSCRLLGIFNIPCFLCRLSPLFTEEWHCWYHWTWDVAAECIDVSCSWHALLRGLCSLGEDNIVLVGQTNIFVIQTPTEKVVGPLGCQQTLICWCMLHNNDGLLDKLLCRSCGFSQLGTVMVFRALRKFSCCFSDTAASNQVLTVKEEICRSLKDSSILYLYMQNMLLEGKSLDVLKWSELLKIYSCPLALMSQEKQKLWRTKTLRALFNSWMA